MTTLANISQPALAQFIERAIARGELHPTLTIAEIQLLENRRRIVQLLGDGHPARHAVAVKSEIRNLKSEISEAAPHV